MGVIQKLGGLSEVPIAPVEFQDAVESWARKSGRHATISWVSMMEAFAVHITVSPNSPLMKMYQAGDLEEVPTESVPLIENHEDGKMCGIKLDDFGPSGIVMLLEKGDVWSGQGEYDSLVSAVLAQIEQHRKLRIEKSAAAGEVGQEIGWLTRRSVLKLPQVGVAIDLDNSKDAGLDAPGTLSGASSLSLSTPTTVE